MKHNLRSLADLKRTGSPITWLTCYEYSFATALNKTDLDMILVGDSGGMVALGHKDTVPVTMDEMILLSQAVRRGAPDKFIVGDMPKGSYEVSNEDAVVNAMRFVKESGCDAVKLEGGTNVTDRVQAIVDSGISVIGHIGLTPQSAGNLGGYRVFGRHKDEFDHLLKSIKELEKSGVFGILLEATPPKVSRELVQNAQVIIFGIGAGSHVHGQLLILHDLLGLFDSFRPKFAKCYIPHVIDDFIIKIKNQKDLVQYGRDSRLDGLHEITRMAVNAYVEEVRNGNFPTSDYSYKD